MIFEVVTLFPEMFSSVLSAQPARQGDREAARSRCTSPIRATSPTDKHRSVDDTPYGGGAGMVMRPEPLVAAIEHVEARARPGAQDPALPDGRAARRRRRCRGWPTLPRLVLVCGRYEGFDERVRAFVDEELSIGDFVLTGGELAAMVVDRRGGAAPARRARQRRLARRRELRGGPARVSAVHAPAEFRGVAVPEVLLSGNHERIRAGAACRRCCAPATRRPDLFARLALSDEDRALLDGEEP